MGPILLRAWRLSALVLVIAALAWSAIAPAPLVPLSDRQAEASRVASGVLPAPSSETAVQPQDIEASATRRTDLPAFGMTIVYYHAGSVPIARRVGARSVLIPFWWKEIEPVRTEPATYDWSTTDSKISLALANGLEPLIVITGNPSWAFEDEYQLLTPTGRTALAQLAAAAAARYQGQVRLWSFYNEPDCNGPTATPTWYVPSSCYGNYGSEYTALLREIYPAVKAANPEALVVMGGLAADNFQEWNGFQRQFLDDVLSSGGGNYFDIMNFHYYTAFASVWQSYGTDVIGKTNWIRERMAAHGVDKPIILSEIGRPGADGGDEIQADYVIQGTARALAAGNDMVVWYELMDAPQDPARHKFGIFNPDGSPKPAARAYQLVTRQWEGIAHSARAEHGYAGVEAYSFQAADGSRRQLAVWSRDGSERTITVPADAVIKHSWRHCPESISGSTVTVGPHPVILEFLSYASPSGATGAFRAFFPTIQRHACP